MRATDQCEGFSVRAIAGTRAVMLAMNARRDVLADFLGFAVGVRNTPGGDVRWLNGFKCFKSLEPDPVRAQRFRTVDHPIQDFRWGHYSAEPDTEGLSLVATAGNWVPKLREYDRRIMVRALLSE